VHYLLFYDYVEGILERRAPHRDAHLALARDAHARGDLVMAGAYAEPVDGAVFVFRGEGPEVAEAFVKQDPYVANDLVKSWRIRPWTVAVGSPSGT
jgi:uncharacterized protein YciI